MRRRIIELAVIVFAFHAQTALSQATDLTHALHEKVEHFPIIILDPKDLQETQKAFSNHTKEELASALIADLDADRGTPSKNHTRNFSVGRLYQALNLPVALVCKELENEQSPQRKVQLMAVLWGLKTPEVTAALLHQIKDRRSAEDYIGWPEEPVEALRVCDVACNTLAHNLVGGTRRIGFSSDADHRDGVIKRTLKELNLDSSH